MEIYVHPPSAVAHLAVDGSVTRVRTLGFDASVELQGVLDYLATKLSAEDYKVATDLLRGAFDPVRAAALHASNGADNVRGHVRDAGENVRGQVRDAGDPPPAAA